LKQVLKNGIAALHFSLEETSPPGAHAHASVVPDSHRHSHGSFSSGDYGGIRKRIEGARLSESTVLHALAILEILARAESHIHNVALEDVHFHELAAWDSLMDVVAAGSLISALDGAAWSISALPLGSGQVETRHGLLPVPAPATMRILEAYEWRSDNIPGERVTPTGAAIVRHLVAPEQSLNLPEGTYRAGGYGAGTRDFREIANVLRVMVFEKEAHAPDRSAATEES